MKKINQQLIKKLGLSEETVAKIKQSYALEEDIIIEMRKETDSKKLMEWAEKWHQTQFEQQRLWGFKEDINYHRWWYLPGCRCAKMDNEDSYPTGMYWKTEDCPIHGKHTWKTKDETILA